MCVMFPVYRVTTPECILRSIMYVSCDNVIDHTSNGPTSRSCSDVKCSTIMCIYSPTKGILKSISIFMYYYCYTIVLYCHVIVY